MSSCWWKSSHELNFGVNRPITVHEKCFKLSQNALSRNVKESGKVILDPYPDSDQHQDLTTSAYQVWPTSINAFVSYLADRRTAMQTHTRVITISAPPAERNLGSRTRKKRDVTSHFLFAWNDTHDWFDPVTFARSRFYLQIFTDEQWLVDAKQ